MKIYTLTLSPAYDVHAVAEKILACHENLATVSSRQAGGKGVNISRALQHYDVPNTAVVVLGSQNSAEFEQSLAQHQLNCHLIKQEGRIRENLTIHCANEPETRISFTGFSVSEQILKDIKQKICADPDTVVTFTGRVPEGMSMAAVKAFLTALQAQGAKIVLDSRSFTLEDILEVRPWLIKPNKEEIAMFFRCPVETMEAALEKAKVFAGYGVENAMISLGEEGALLIVAGRTYIAKPPVIDAISTIGAGDSSIAGFLAAAKQGKCAEECLRTAVAFGTAACLTEGTLPPRKEDIDRILEQVVITEVV